MLGVPGGVRGVPTGSRQTPLIRAKPNGYRVIAQPVARAANVTVTRWVEGNNALPRKTVAVSGVAPPN